MIPAKGPHADIELALGGVLAVAEVDRWHWVAVAYAEHLIRALARSAADSQADPAVVGSHQIGDEIGVDTRSELGVRIDHCGGGEFVAKAGAVLGIGEAAVLAALCQHRGSVGLGRHLV